VSEMTAAGLFDSLVKVKYEIPNDKPEMFGQYSAAMDKTCAGLLEKHRRADGDGAQAKERK
ncbi:MAG TPA: hypothetical protein H9883_10355, partial [Candidatus Ruthenibacterium merdigallinarum]|nr:hypothetical protein [Candidatus Ruthenibacterium merdigallinarum]